MTAKDIVREDDARMKRMYTGFDPLTGEGAPPYRRKLVKIPDFVLPRQYVPLSMMKNGLLRQVLTCRSISNFIREYYNREPNDEMIEEVTRSLLKVRSRHDFSFWCYVFVKIKPKEGGDMIPFRLRHEQRKLLEVLEDLRLKGVPIRIILLKARQWGGSTMVQIYMAWIQLLHKTAWYSTIVAQTKDVSYKIMEMYSKLLENYPSWMLDIEDESLHFSQYGHSKSDFKVTYGSGATPARDTVIQIGTYLEPDNVRGGDSALIHYSEVGLWPETKGNTPERMVRSVSGGLLEAPMTVEVMESTANGTGNYFHREWMSAERGESSRTPVFIPFYFIEHDFVEVEDREAFAENLYANRLNMYSPSDREESGAYLWSLWESGATLGAINWYIMKRRSYNNHADMASEAPANATEAFKHSGHRVFDIDKVRKMRKYCRTPEFVGDVYGDAPDGPGCLRNVRFSVDAQGLLKVWSLPEKDDTVKNRYLVVVDVGGRSRSADYSVIYVLDRMGMLIGGYPETAAEWHGHIDHDRLAWKSAQIASLYHDALLVIESNTLETKDRERDTEGDHTAYILNRIGSAYSNLYFRTSSEEEISMGVSRKWGFHTNTSTKPLIIDNLITCVRDMLWIERCEGCLDELDWYEKKENGSYGAISGQHDDRLMTRAIGLYICFSDMDIPVDISENRKKKKKKSKHTTLTEASI